MKKFKDYILSNLVFITRLPVNINFEYRSDKGNVKFFPLVGIILGLILFVLLFLFSNFNYLLQATLIVTIHIFLTGGIHLDGLSDMSDGILSYKDRDKMIEIMKDSRIGAMGVIALILLVILKITSVYEIILNKNLFFIIFFPIYGRLGIVSLCFFGRPIDKSRLGVGFIGNISTKEFLLINISYLFIINLICMIFIKSSILLIMFFIINTLTLFVVILSMFYMTKKITNYIGGISGDILGAGCEICELLSIISLCLLFFVFRKGI